MFTTNGIHPATHSTTGMASTNTSENQQHLVNLTTAPYSKTFFFNFITYCISTLSCKYLSLPNLIFIKQSKDYFQKLLQIKFQFYKDLFYYVPKEVSIGIFAYNTGN